MRRIAAAYRCDKRQCDCFATTHNSVLEYEPKEVIKVFDGEVVAEFLQHKCSIAEHNGQCDWVTLP
jgi:hypothetical protein